MLQILFIIFAATFGYVVAILLGTDNLEGSALYTYLVTSFLAVGLYGSTCGIDLESLKVNRKTVFSAVTLGVFLKIVIIGGTLYYITGEVVSVLLAPILAQIDPLSVVALIGNNQLTKRAKTVLISWSSFDDPVTVIIAFYVSSVLLEFSTFATGSFGLSSLSASSFDPIPLILNFAYNIGFATIFYLLSKINHVRKSLPVQTILLLVALIMSILFNLMLGIALVGLVIRPHLLRNEIEVFIQYGVTFSLYAATVLLGMLLINGASIIDGFQLALVTIIAQVIVALLIAFRFSKSDKLRLAFAQQNGVTAIVLSLLFEPSFPGTIATVAPAILIVNVFYILANYILDQFPFAERISALHLSEYDRLYRNREFVEQNADLFEPQVRKAYSKLGRGAVLIDDSNRLEYVSIKDVVKMRSNLSSGSKHYKRIEYYDPEKEFVVINQKNGNSVKSSYKVPFLSTT